MNPGFIITLCLILSAFFSGMEIAFLSANRLRIELDRKQAHFSSRIIHIFTKKPSHYIATMLIGNNIVLVIYGILIAGILEPYIHRFIDHTLLVLIIQTIISTIFILVTAEFLPKLIFRLIPNNLLKTFSVPVLIFYVLFYPLTAFVIWLSNLFLKWFVKNNKSHSDNIYVFSKTDLNHLVQDINQKNKRELDTEHEIRIFQNALDFTNVKVRDCLIPRTEIVALEDSISIEELRQEFIKSGFSKILIFEDNIDNIVGYVSSKDLFKNPEAIKSITIKVPIVPETMNANKLLRVLLQERKSIAVVVDEFGGTSGIVTTEDIMEEIFGEIEDEHDTNEIVEKVLPEGSYIFSGKLQIDYLNKTYNLNLPESEDYDTLAGFIFNNLGRIPSLSEHVIIEPFKIKILKTDNKRLDLIYLKIIDN